MKRWVVALALLCAGCAFQLEPCAADEDCPPGTTCERPARTGAPMCIAPDELVDPEADAATGQNNAAVEPDTSIAPQDTGSHSSNNDRPIHCPVVASCGADEPNDTEDDAINLTRFAQGCASFDFEEWAMIYQDSVCDGDVDQFVVEYEACDAGSFKLTVSLTTPDTCRAGGDLQIAEGLYDCWDENVRCEVVDDVQRIIVIIPPNPRIRSVEKMRFAVRQGLADGGVDYILRATIDR